MQTQPATTIQTLIVEDDVVSRKALLRILSLRGIAAQGAANLAQALEALVHVPQTLILDLMLPDGSGIEVLREVRRSGMPTRVAVLTGADKPMISEAESLGPDAVFIKPVDVTKLMQWLKMP